MLEDTWNVRVQSVSLQHVFIEQQSSIACIHKNEYMYKAR